MYISYLNQCFMLLLYLAGCKSKIIALYFVINYLNIVLFTEDIINLYTIGIFYTYSSSEDSKYCA